MASKSDKEGKGSKKSAPQSPKETPDKVSPKSKKQLDDEDDDEIDDDDSDTPKPSSKKTAKSSSKKKDEDDDDDDDDGVEEVDEWEKVEEEEEWDPDFEEFDIPKSKGKKTTGVAGKKPVEEEEDFKVDDEFKDLFDGGDEFDDEEDDY